MVNSMRPEDYPQYCRDDYGVRYEWCIDDVYRALTEDGIYKYWSDMHFPVTQFYTETVTVWGRVFESAPYELCKSCGVGEGDGHVSTCPEVPQPFGPPPYVWPPRVPNPPGTLGHEQDGSSERERQVIRQLDLVSAHASREGWPGFRSVLQTAAFTLGELVYAGHLTKDEASRKLLAAMVAVGHDPDGNDILWIDQGLTDGIASGERHTLPCPECNAYTFSTHVPGCPARWPGRVSR